METAQRQRQRCAWRNCGEQATFRFVVDGVAMPYCGRHPLCTVSFCDAVATHYVIKRYFLDVTVQEQRFDLCAHHQSSDLEAYSNHGCEDFLND